MAIKCSSSHLNNHILKSPALQEGQKKQRARTNLQPLPGSFMVLVNTMKKMSPVKTNKTYFQHSEYMATQQFNPPLPIRSIHEPKLLLLQFLAPHGVFSGSLLCNCLRKSQFPKTPKHISKGDSSVQLSPGEYVTTGVSTQACRNARLGWV